MKEYENDTAEVFYTFWRGFSIVLKSNGRVFRPSKQEKHLIGVVHHTLKKRGYDSVRDEVAKSVVMDWFIDFCIAPRGGLYQRAVLGQHPSEVVDCFVRQIEAFRGVR